MCVAGINFEICLYLTNKIKFISKNTENIFFVLILVFIAFLDVPIFMEMGFVNKKIFTFYTIQNILYNEILSVYRQDYTVIKASLFMELFQAGSFNVVADQCINYKHSGSRN